MGEGVVAACERQELLLEALLTLSRSELGRLRREPVDLAAFTIANTGPLIPTDELTRLFQPFQRLSSHPGPSADGVGLGLAIVQAIANAHDAEVTAQVRTGGGLRIEVDFPAETWPTPLAA